MKLICGLGNPGREYEGHRHNIGFRVAEKLSGRAGADFTQRKFDARIAQGKLGAEKVLVVLPQTFMNLSGQSLASAARFYKILLPDIIVIHDELDLPFGRLQLKASGGAGGHNGLKSILECLGEDSFARLRFGIGKPEGPNAKERVVGHVLANFTAEEARHLDPLIDRAADAVECWAGDGLPRAMNQFNKR